jgi:DNA-binding MarR family transcriptional regulator
MSRHLLDLGIMRRNRSRGLGFISQQQDKDDLRKNVYRLAPKGKALVEEMDAALFRRAG